MRILNNLFKYLVLIIISCSILNADSYELSLRQKKLLNEISLKFKEKKYQSVIDDLESFLKNDPTIKHHLLYLNLGNAYALSDKPEIAFDAYNKGLLLNPDSIDLIGNIVKTFITFNKHEEAIMFLKKKIALGNSDLRILEFTADLYAYSGMYEEAVKYYEQILNVEKNDMRILTVTANIYYVNGYFEQALKYIEQALHLKKDNGCMMLKVKIYFKMKLYSQALLIADGITENFGDSAELYFLKGLCNYKLNNMNNALDCFHNSKLFNEYRDISAKYIYEINRMKK